MKDIRNRFEMLRGSRVHYVPGWDCHGLPIELKALGELTPSSLTPLQIRQKGKASSSFSDQSAAGYGFIMHGHGYKIPVVVVVE